MNERSARNERANFVTWWRNRGESEEDSPLPRVPPSERLGSYCICEKPSDSNRAHEFLIFDRDAKFCADIVVAANRTGFDG